MAITDSTHAHYSRNERDWRLIRRMKSGHNVGRELTRRYFEHSDHFSQRKSDADHTPRTSYLLGRLTGMLFQREPEVERRLGPLDEEALESAGPKGEDYKIQLLELAETLLAYDEAVVVLNPARGLEIESPLAMPNWTSSEAAIKGERVPAGSLFGDRPSIETWTRYTPTGWEVYREATDEDDEEEEVRIDYGFYVDTPEEEEPPYFTAKDGTPTAPVLRIEMPWDEAPGLQIAKKHRSIFRMVSRRDFSVSAAMNGIIQLGVGGDSDLADNISHKAKNGSQIWPYDKDQGEHKGLQLPTEGAELGSEVIEDKTEELNRVAYNELQKAARTAQSATEAQIQRSGGAAAALSVLAATLADAETRILRLMAQAEDFQLAGPNPRELSISADWPADFSEVSPSESSSDSSDEGS